MARNSALAAGYRHRRGRVGHRSHDARPFGESSFERLDRNAGTDRDHELIADVAFDRAEHFGTYANHDVVADSGVPLAPLFARAAEGATIDRCRAPGDAPINEQRASGNRRAGSSGYPTGRI